MKRVAQIASQERGSIVTMALAVNADIDRIPQFFLFPRPKMQFTFIENATPGAMGYANRIPPHCH